MAADCTDLAGVLDREVKHKLVPIGGDLDRYPSRLRCSCQVGRRGRVGHGERGNGCDASSKELP